MSRKRPCRICRKWFRPDRRAGDRQHACSEPSCQRERHRRNCAAWRERNRDEERAHRLRQRLRSVASREAETPLARQLAWPVARDAVGLQVAVLVEESAKVLQEWVRDAVPP